MPKFRIRTHELVWQYSTYIVEAESSEEAADTVENEQVWADETDFDVIEQIDIDWVEELEDE